ncbi:MAG: inorganic phosphate transporter [Sulfuritalea sp.]|nr:inorganic phosphate transporter [Sulfuritalea sp.]MDP1981106.1 inorganic phosphate transporter [Sulfuritalea sp.]
MTISRASPRSGARASRATDAPGLPVSTTHVSVGSIAGVGAAAGTLDWATVRNIALAWIITLPLAAAIAWLAATRFTPM